MHFLRASNYDSRPKTDKFIIPPAHAVHVDYSYNDAPEYIRTLPERPPDWERLSRFRWAIFSCWRPVKKVTRDALCLGDKRTIPDRDLIDGSTDMPVNGRQRRTVRLMEERGVHRIREFIWSRSAKSMLTGLLQGIQYGQ
ncbi:methyltransferase [Penicillium samsonianum]|uniref:methyltransferase n=1 Tax=Penicillium samsonianum TaxID=1882272 RepID=UPI00254746A0|nr:methyltransferase [Penicillium samsonianum]KAJ6132500.1 methyltransferase [Penicillium samsonianum]